MRVFEAMEAGAVPVIISDDWIPPLGMQWEQFSLRIAEEDIGLIPSLLESRRSELYSMGRAARQVWEDYFAPDRIFNWLIDQARELILTSSISFSCWRTKQILRPRNLRRVAPILIKSCLRSH